MSLRAPAPLPVSFCASVECLDGECAVVQPRVDGFAEKGGNVVGHAVVAVDCDELGLKPAAENVRLGIAVRASQHPATQRSIDVYRAARDDLRAGRDRADDGHVTLVEERLA